MQEAVEGPGETGEEEGDAAGRQARLTGSCTASIKGLSPVLRLQGHTGRFYAEYQCILTLFQRISLVII